MYLVSQEESHGFLNVVDIGGDLLEELPSPVRHGKTKMKGKQSPHRRQPTPPSPHRHVPSPASPRRDLSTPRKARTSPGRDQESPRKGFSPRSRARSQSKGTSICAHLCMYLIMTTYVCAFCVCISGCHWEVIALSHGLNYNMFQGYL